VNIDMTPPVIAVSAPADQSTVSQAGVTITGNATDALSGTALVTCGGATGTLSASAFTCNVTLNVGLNLIVIKATDAAGNVSASKLHLALAGTLSAPNTLTATPSGVNMVVGGMQQFTAVDELGRPRTDATWTISDTTIATITSDSSPLLTAVGVGQATLTATVGSVTGQTTVNVLSGTSLPAGTLLWSAPPPAGYTVGQILQAAPSMGTPDIYTVAWASGSCMVTGFTGGGPSLWTTPLCGTGTPDGSGGLLLATENQIVDLDGQTGTPVWTTAVPVGSSQLTVGQDGTIYYTGTYDTSTGAWGLVALAADTGIAKLLYTPPQGIEEFKSCNGNIADYPWGVEYLSQPVIGPDGTLFAGIMVGNLLQDNSYDNCKSYTITEDQQLSLLQIAPGGSPTVTLFKDDQTQYSGAFPQDQIEVVIPDGQGGALVGWSISTGGQQYQGHVTDVTNSGSSDFSISGQPYEMVLGENGLAFANNGGTITAFNITTGSSVWTYQAPAGNGLSIVEATHGGGITINDSNAGVIQFDASGSVSSSGGVSFLQGAQPLDIGSWISNDPGLPALLWSPNGANGILTLLAQSVFPMVSGNAQGQHIPPFCQRKNSNCALAPNQDTTFTNPLWSVKERDVTYNLFSLQNGTLLPTWGNAVGSGQALGIKIEVMETSENPNGVSNIRICDWKSPLTQCEMSGSYTDRYTEGSSNGTDTVLQQFFVDRGQVQVFWPTDGFNSQGFPIQTWYGAWNQNATITNNSVIIQQNNPNMQRGAACPQGCSLIQANNTP
jgi:hypothetical protein